jgi:hypothetical protein
MQICAQAELDVTCNACVAGHVHSARKRTTLTDSILIFGKRQQRVCLGVCTTSRIGCMPPGRPQAQSVVG